MRAYFFGNMYLSSIQQGIQAQHVTSELFIKYHETFTDRQDQAASILYTWAKDHKTSVLLSAGYSEEIYSLITFFNVVDNPFPWAPFFEGKDALDGALTCVGIILPEEIYNAAKALRDNTITTPTWGVYTPSDFEVALATRLNNYQLAK